MLKIFIFSSFFLISLNSFGSEVCILKNDLRISMECTDVEWLKKCHSNSVCSEAEGRTVEMFATYIKSVKVLADEGYKTTDGKLFIKD